MTTGYDDAAFTGASFGFGIPPTTWLFLPGVLRSIWAGRSGPADELGIELDEIREKVEQWEATEPIDCTMIHVDPGGVAAVRFAVDGVVDGRTVITMEHVIRLTEAAAPEWPFPPDGRPGVHRVVGRPTRDRDQHPCRSRRNGPQRSGRDRHGYESRQRHSGGLRRGTRTCVPA